MFKALVLGSLAFIAFGLYALLGDANTAHSAPLAVGGTPSREVEVVGFKCITHRTGTDMTGSLRNTSRKPLAFVKIYASFDGETFSGYINENPLQPGNLSTFLIPGPPSPAAKCALLYVQDRDGRRIN